MEDRWIRWTHPHPQTVSRPHSGGSWLLDLSLAFCPSVLTALGIRWVVSGSCDAGEHFNDVYD